ncbi:hypothetical protein L208DRAFT_1382661 [Tricholoma matsutake]|nr:hypothetical protein L208DRAFT_1382661 [Tricholoma matsutake 945]
MKKYKKEAANDTLAYTSLNSDKECDWDGTVNHYLSSVRDSAWTDSEADDEDDSEGTEYSDLEGDSLVESLQKTLEAELESLRKPTPYEAIKQDLSTKNWKKAEQNQGFGYGGHSDQTKRCHDKKVHDKEEEDKNLQKFKSASLIWSYFQPTPTAPTPSTVPQPSSIPHGLTQTIDLAAIPTALVVINQSSEIFTGYLSDVSDDKFMPEDDDHSDGEKEDERVRNIPSTNEPSVPSFSIQPPPSLKQRHLKVPAHVKIQKAREEHQAGLALALQDIEKLIRSKRDIFEAGQEGLQPYRVRAIQSYLQMVVHNKCNGMTASQIAAESQGFAASWGAQMVRKWVQHWVKDRLLPISA